MSNEEFVEKWVEAFLNDHGQVWIAQELEVSRQWVSAKALALRGKGVDLPNLTRAPGHFGPSTKGTDPAALNRYIEERTGRAITY